MSSAEIQRIFGRDCAETWKLGNQKENGDQKVFHQTSYQTLRDLRCNGDVDPTA